MKIMERFIMLFSGLKKLSGLVAVIFFALSLVGCALNPSEGVLENLSFSEKAALKKAVAKDSFPTASQAGIVSNVSSDTK